MVTRGDKAEGKAVVEDVDVSFRRQDFHHKSEFEKVEQKANEEHEDDGNVRCNGKHHCWL